MHEAELPGLGFGYPPTPQKIRAMLPVTLGKIPMLWLAFSQN